MESIEDVVINVTPQEVAYAVQNEVGGDRPVNASGKDIFEFLDIGDNVADVEFEYTVPYYRTPGKDYGFYELQDDTEVVEGGKPEIESVTIIVNGAEMEDDGSVQNALQDLFNTGRMYIDTSDSSEFISQDDYFDY